MMIIAWALSLGLLVGTQAALSSGLITETSAALVAAAITIPWGLHVITRVGEWIDRQNKKKQGPNNVGG